MYVDWKRWSWALVALLSVPSTPALAGSWIIPGATTGTPAGAVPPPGLYFANTVYYGTGAGPAGTTIASGGESPFFLWVPGWNFLGASYAATIGFPCIEVGIQTPGHTADTYLKGPFNPYINPLTLSWNLGRGLFLAVGEGFYVPVGTAVVNSPSGGLRSGASFETELNISYLANGWILSANNMVGITTPDVAGYKTANYFNSDWTFAHTFGNWKFGAIGYGSGDLESVPLAPGLPHRTTPALQVGVGGLMGYNFGSVELILRATHQLITKGTFADSGKDDTRVWATAIIPIWKGTLETPSRQLIAKY
ncbi:Putative MetA-pathway of phenol degradation [Bradyrhizobium erythrophlei]|uniref:Putative MetA-pathway of phenol degradation n=1 Tax=Bradyrhizobium erythrophlei TaxID=1437360 RepID=A0A1H4Z0H1_9BRAD|nr:Putative MetA-pathway of phenol degradation [Bradyrhizobium erythrophlei]